AVSPSLKNTSPGLIPGLFFRLLGLCRVVSLTYGISQKADPPCSSCKNENPEPRAQSNPSPAQPQWLLQPIEASVGHCLAPQNVPPAMTEYGRLSVRRNSAPA